jgi:L-rhamnose mutarotase
MIRRRAQVIRLRPERREEYIEKHRAVFPEVVASLKAAGYQNYSIFLRDDLLFSYFEYDSEFDIDARHAAMRGSAVLEPWRSLMAACQQPLDSAGPNEWWASMEEVYHLD